MGISRKSMNGDGKCMCVHVQICIKCEKKFFSLPGLKSFFEISNSAHFLTALLNLM